MYTIFNTVTKRQSIVFLLYFVVSSGRFVRSLAVFVRALTDLTSLQVCGEIDAVEKLPECDRQGMQQLHPCVVKQFGGVLEGG